MSHTAQSRTFTMRRLIVAIVAGFSLAGLPAIANSLVERMNEFEAANPMPDPAPPPFNDPKDLPDWISRCTSAQAAYNRWEVAQFEYGIQKFNAFRKAGARNEYYSQAEQTNSPAATCGCLAEKRSTALSSMSAETADSLISSQYQRFRRLWG